MLLLVIILDLIERGDAQKRKEGTSPAAAGTAAVVRSAAAAAAAVVRSAAAAAAVARQAAANAAKV